MESKIFEEISIADLFDQFIEASTMRGVLSLHHRILNYSDLEPCEFNIFYPKFKKSITDSRQRKNWRAKAIFSKIDKKANLRCYSNTKMISPPYLDNHNGDSNNNGIGLHHALLSNDALQHHSCLIIGGGPAGLRTAIELQLLGAKRVMVAEKRSRFSRNNVVHLWPFVIDDLKSLGAKKFYGKFCAGSIDHISIRQLQLTLLKICLIIGCDFRDSCSYISNCPASIKSMDEPMSGRSLGGIEGDIVDEKDNDHSLSVNNETGDKNNKTIKNLNDETICDLDLIDKQERAKTHEYSSDFVRVSRIIIPNSAISDPYIANTASHNSMQDYQSQSSFHQNDATNEMMNDKENISNRINISNDYSRSSPNITHLTDNHQQNCDHETSIKTNETPNGAKLSSMKKPNLRGAKVHFECDAKHVELELHSQEWDVIIGADGHRNTLKNLFPRKEFRGKLAIAITANFINRQTPIEAAVPEISGISFIYNQDMFNALSYDTNIDLENICYYKDDTHYFVMTAKKKSLIERGVLLSDYTTTQQLLADSNVNKEALLKFARDAAYWTTGLEPLDFALNHYGQDDCAMFDFTSMYASMNACKAVRTRAGGLALFGLVGDSLLEPFWPTGSGCARGFLSSFDAAWMCRQWAVNKCAILDYHENHKTSSKPNSRAKHNHNNRSSSCYELTTNNKMVLSVMAERESIYRILAQTTSENLQQNYAHWTLNPHTRYPNLNRHLLLPSQVEHLIVDENFRSFSLTTRMDSRARKVKSPTSASKSSSTRKSPKKLKSSIKSLVNNNNKNHETPTFRSRSSLSSDKSSVYKSKSRPEVGSNNYWEFEESYRNLSDDRNGPIQYLNYDFSSKNSSNQKEYSIYATTNRRSQQLSSNIYDDEMARRARDIDDCIRLRRQRNQISIVRNQMMERCYDPETDGKTSSKNTRTSDIGIKGQLSAESATLLNKLKRAREQRLAVSAGGPWKDNNSNRQEPMSPLFLLNSIRRCASFAERVKSFEGKLEMPSVGKHPNGPSSPKTAPIDNVRNLPQFATLQRLLTNKHRSSDSLNGTDLNHGGASLYDHQPKKSKIPIMKLTKQDWNVKCWEERLAAYEKRGNASKENANNHYLANHDSRESSLSKSKSEDYAIKRNTKAPKQVEVFKDRIKEMANKLELKQDEIDANCRSNKSGLLARRTKMNEQTGMLSSNNLNTLRMQQDSHSKQSKGWVSHLRQELIKSSQESSFSSQIRRSNQPTRPVKKLFNDTDDDDQDNSSNKKLNQDSLDPDKHYDHLCINRPKNKYLSRNNYKSHLSRIKYDKDTSIVLNRQPTHEEKRLYIANLESQAKSLDSNDACNYISSNKSQTPSLGTEVANSSIKDNVDLCPRCKSKVKYRDGITINDTLLHRSCLICANCSITLRSTEIQYHLNHLKAVEDHDKTRSSISEKFLCAICKPSIRVDLCRVVQDRLARAKNQSNEDSITRPAPTSSSTCRRMTLASTSSATIESDSLRPIRSRDDFLSERINYNELYKNIVDDANKNNSNNLIKPSPTNPISDNGQRTWESSTCQNRRENFKIAKSESVDGSEVVTLILPIDEHHNEKQATPSSQCAEPKGLMLDEEDIERILHLDIKKNQPVHHHDQSQSSGDEEPKSDADLSDDKSAYSQADCNRSSEPFDDSSSLNSTLDSLTENDDSEADSISVSDSYTGSNSAINSNQANIENDVGQSI